MTVTAGYDIHGVQLVALAANRAPLDVLDRRLRLFGNRAAAEVHVRLHLGAANVEPPCWASRPVYDAPGAHVAYYDEVDELYVAYRGVRLRCAPDRGLIHVWWPRGDAADVWVATHPLLTIALVEVLKRRCLYSLHAACAATGDGGLLMAGPSGAGKSTLAIALALAGWQFLSDDMVFLTAGPPGGEVLGFPDEVDVTEQTLAMFPELIGVARAPETVDRAKASLRLEEALGTIPLLRCPPAVLVLPTVAQSLHSTLVQVGPAEALVELAPNVLLTEAVSAQAHLGALAHLVEHVPCYRLHTGRDLDEVVTMLATTVGEAAGVPGPGGTAGAHPA